VTLQKFKYKVTLEFTREKNQPHSHTTSQQFSFLIYKIIYWHSGRTLSLPNCVLPLSPAKSNSTIAHHAAKATVKNHNMHTIYKVQRLL